MSYRKQKQEALRIKLTELRWKGGWQHESGIIKIHIGDSPSWISLQKIKSAVRRVNLRNLSRMHKKDEKLSSITCNKVA